MSKKILTPAVAIAGAALAAASISSAAGSPFAADSMKSGYMLLTQAEGDGDGDGEKASEEGKCGEGKCGGSS